MKKFIFIILIGIAFLVSPAIYGSPYELSLESESLIAIYDVGWEDFDPRVVRICSLGNAYIWKGSTILELFLEICPSGQVERGVKLIAAFYDYRDARWIFLYVLLEDARELMHLI